MQPEEILSHLAYKASSAGQSQDDRRKAIGKHLLILASRSADLSAKFSPEPSTFAAQEVYNQLERDDLLSLKLGTAVEEAVKKKFGQVVDVDTASERKLLSGK